MAVEASQPEVRRTGPGGCPVLHGFDPLGRDEVYEPERYASLSRREAPVFFVPELDMYVATRHEDVARVIADHETFAPHLPSFHAVPEEARAELPTGFVFQSPGFLLTESPPEHTRLRRLAQNAFTPRAAQAKAPEIRALCNALIDEFVDAGQVDLVRAFTSRFPIRVLAVVMGLDPAIGPQLYEWAGSVGPLLGQTELSRDELLALCEQQAQFRRWTLELIEERRRNPLREGDVVTAMIGARDEDGTPRLTDDEIFGVIVAMVLGGADTSATTTAQLLHRLLRDDALHARVRDEPDVLDRLLEEELRHDFIGRLTFRRVARDGVELGGVALPRDAVVGAHIWSANHDEDVFAEPERYDPDRRDVGELLSWSKGTHFCMGAPLARVQIRIAIECLLERLPGLRLVSGHELERRLSFFIPSIEKGLVVSWQTPWIA